MARTDLRRLHKPGGPNVCAKASLERPDAIEGAHPERVERAGWRELAGLVRRDHVHRIQDRNLGVVKGTSGHMLHSKIVNSTNLTGTTLCVTSAC